MNKRSLLKLAGASAVLAVISGCATVPGDPYYDGGSYGPGYDNRPVLGGGYPVYHDRDRWEDMRDDRERRAWRERQGERDRARAQWDREQRDRDRDHARARDRERDDRARRDAERARDRDRDRNNTDWARAQRERDLARAQRDQQRAASQPGRKPDGSPRTDFDRYNPKTGQWMPRQEDMP